MMALEVRTALVGVQAHLQNGAMHALLWPMRRSRLGPESIREIVFGTEDGVVQNMALIAGMVGAGISSSVILLAGSINGIAAQAIAALVRLGESRPDAEHLVNLAQERDPTIENADALLAAAFASRPG